MASEAYIKWCEEVKERTDLVALVKEAGGDPKPANRYQMMCKSPLRADHDPSFRIYVDQQSWYDFGARIGGDQIEFVQQWKGVDFNGAIDFLAARLGMEWKSQGGKKLDPETEAEVTRHIERRWVVKLATDAANYYHSRLPKKIREWLKSHYGFDDDIIERLVIGWSDDSLLDYMHGTQKIPIDDLLKTGLFIKTQGGRIIEHHAHRVTFPYWKKSSAPYMISRRVDGETPENDYQKAKYKKSLTKTENHPYVSKWIRNDILYGEDSTLKHQRVLLICEGVTDSISAIVCGYAVISPVTVRFRNDDIERVLALSKNADIVVIVNDNEAPRAHEKTGKTIQPGLDGAADMAKVLYEAGRDVRIARLPRADDVDKVDLNSFVKDNGKDALRPVVDDALAYPEFLVWRIPKDTRPAELDEKLSSVYEAIASAPSATQREAYVNRVCEHFGLTRDTVNDAVGEFVKAKAQAPAPVNPKPGANGSSGSGGSGDAPTDNSNGKSNGDGGGEPWREPQIRGQVLTNEQSHYYFTLGRDEGGNNSETRISNFILVPTKSVTTPDGRQIHGDVFKFDEETKRPVPGAIGQLVLPAGSFNSARRFRDAAQRDLEISWSGSDNNVQSVFEILNTYRAPIHRGVHTLGYTQADGSAFLVLPDRVVDKDGTCVTAKIAYTKPVPPPIASRIRTEGIDAKDEDIAKLAARVLPKIFSLNTGDIILPLQGWFSAAAVSPVIRDILSHFPHLQCCGTAGSGKSTLICDIFWPSANGCVGDAFSCEDTKFAWVSALSDSSSYVLVYDEYTNLAPYNEQYINGGIKENYKGGEHQRGRVDQRVNRFPARTSLCVIGERFPVDTAVTERMVLVSPMKTSLTAATRQLIRELNREPLHLLGGHYHRWCLSQDITDMMENARAHMKARYLPLLGSVQLRPRIEDNLLVVVFGNLMHEAWCRHLGVIVPNRHAMKEYFVKIANVLCDVDGDGEFGTLAQPKDEFDRFLAACSTYANIGALRENTHYALVRGKLCLHLDSCLLEYQKQKNQAGQRDESKGLTALRRVLREKEQQGCAYLVCRSHRVTLGGRSVHCVSIDLAAVPEHLRVDRFPFSVDRKQGRRHSVDDDMCDGLTKPHYPTQ